ncbi:MAG: diguanylate cyclase [Gammaproteobacteria bacterium]|nr:diguanylate cyclase [Gammaproteobacteria bacterium]MDH5802737.1 diguanylate cyclase [Gammaproteobacteria bacterium]
MISLKSTHPLQDKIVVATAVSGIVITLLFCWGLYLSNRDLATGEFNWEASRLLVLLSNNINKSINSLHYLSTFYDSSEEVTYEEFQEYTKSFSTLHPEVKAWEWVPLVRGATRDKHEQKISKNIIGYKITEMDSNRNLILANKRPFYYPVTFIHPQAGNTNAMGFDLNSSDSRRQFIEKTIARNALTISTRVRLVQEDSESYSVLAAIPVLKRNTYSPLLKIDSPQILGLVVCVIRIDDIIDKTFLGNFARGVSLSVSQKHDRVTMYKKGEANNFNQHSFNEDIRVANQIWNVTISSDLSRYGARNFYELTVPFIFGIFLSICLSGYLFMLRSSRKRILSINTRLSQEIKKRNQYEQELIKTNLQLKKLSKYDPVMKIANRHAFNDYLRSELKRAKRTGFPLSLLIADIDNFKAYNDTYGHVIGDHCLALVAGVFKENANRPADLPARYGGEEIAVILPETFEEGAKMVAENIRNAVSTLSIPHEKSDVATVVTISIGVITVTKVESYMSDEWIIQSADKALYEAKHSGKNKVSVATLDDNPDGLTHNNVTAIGFQSK